MNEQIDRAGWLAFADQFSVDNEGKPVSIEVVSQELGDEPLVEGVLLMGVDLDPENEGAMLITVIRDDRDFTHIIEAPDVIWVERTEDGQALALEVVAGDGSRTILRFEG